MKPANLLKSILETIKRLNRLDLNQGALDICDRQELADSFGQNAGTLDLKEIEILADEVNKLADLVRTIQEEKEELKRQLNCKEKVANLVLEYETKFRAIYQTEPSCIKILDKEGRLLEMNPAGLAMIEADEFELVKEINIVDLINKEYHKPYLDLIKKVFEGESAKLTIEITGLKGGTKWMENNAVPMKDNQGNIVSMLVVSHDISEIIKAQNDLLKSNERYHLVEKATNDSIWELDIVHGIVVRTGKGFEKLFGYQNDKQNNEELHYKNLVHPQDLNSLLSSLETAIANKNEHYWEHDHRFLKSNGEYAYVHDRAYIIRNNKGVALKLIGATQDVTDRVKHLMEIENQNTKLKEIAWMQSHLVRAPLARMMGIVQVLQEEELNSEDFKNWVSHFVSSSAELDNIIKDITSKSIGLSDDLGL
jgi:PAS domain S-box-containing protein